MRKLLSVILLSLLVQSVRSQSGEGYDPKNPGDPDVYYTLTIETAPLSGGTVSPNNRQKLSAGQSIYVNASPRLGYEFKRWMVSDSLVSTNQSFRFTMPEKDVVLTAYFEWNPEYNPQNPDEPASEGYSHRVYVYATPSAGGYFNSSSFTLIEGETTNIYAYPRKGYRFDSWKCNGEVVSTENPMIIRMGTSDIAYTATFVYNPISPGEPSPNVFNPATGEVVIDNFTPGALNHAIFSVVGSSDNYPLVQSITITGRMQSSDFGFARSYQNCSLIDLSRTTGYTEVPSWSFDSAEALTKLILPASVERMGNKVFYGCKNLSELYCYATTPPEISESTFFGVESSLVIKVPTSAVSLYQKANGWKNFTIIPIDEETCSMVICLPADASDGRYKNMYMELQNAISLQTYKYLINNRTSYTFPNLIRNTSYNIYIKNATGAVLGKKEKVMLGEEDVTIKFDVLLQPQTLIAKVILPDETEVTAQTTITWLNEDGSLLANGAEASGVLEGSNVTCRIVIPQALAIQYRMPTDVAYTVRNTGNEIVCRLQELEKISVSGRIVDATTGKPLSGAAVTVSQSLNGKYTKSFVTLSSNDGVFATNVFNEQSSMTISANNYLSQTTEYQDFSNSQYLGDIPLRAITGAVIAVNFTYTESVEAGQTAQTQDGYPDETNVTYSILNHTTQQPITEFRVQDGNIVLLEEVAEGDVLHITAMSKNAMFKDVEVQAQIDSGKHANVTFPIVEFGGVKAFVSESENNSIVGILYDSEGMLLRKTSFNGDSLTINNLADGSYTLVSMGKSKFFNSVLNLSELTNAGLSEGRDFVSKNVVIASGVITKLDIARVPTFDESLFYYTDENTSFSANKSQVTIGNYITLRAKVGFKEEYANSIRDLRLVVDLPESCSFVDNSVLTGNGIGGYEISGNRISIKMNSLDDVVRFCIIPTAGGTCKPNAFVQFNYGSENILQPIGSAYFSAQNLTLSVPSQTADSVVVVNGTAKTDCIVKIFDDDVLIGQTRSLANGRWSARVNLYKPYSHSFHNIYAEITTSNGQNLLTNTELVEFSKTMPQLKTITMLYNGNTIVFDQIEGTTSTNTYSYVPGKSDFTFIAHFTKNDTALIKNLEFKVLASDGTARRVPSFFSSKYNAWVGKTIYVNSSRIPVNVSAEYSYVGGDIDNTISFNEQTDLLEKCFTSIFHYEEENYEYTVTGENETSVSLEVKNKGNQICNSLIEWLDFDSTVELMNQVQFDFFYDDDGHLECSYTKVDDTEMSTIFVDFKEKVAYKITINMIEQNSVRRAPGVNIGNISVLTTKILSGPFADIVNEAFPYLQIRSDLDFLYDLYKKYSWDLNDVRLRTEDLLFVRCSDGRLRLTDGDIQSFKSEIQIWEREEDIFFDRLYSYIKEYRRKVGYSIAYDIALSMIGGKMAGIFAKCVKFVPQSKLVGSITNFITKNKITNDVTTNHVAKTLSNSLGIALSGIIGTIDNVLNPAFADFRETYRTATTWAPDQFRRLIGKYSALATNIPLNYSKCKDDADEEEENPDEEEENPDYNTPPLKPTIDPSGYVYEGVSSNRLQGVTATAYYMETTEDMYGVLHEEPKIWNAEEYAQKNPLFTDENGMYQWDVPQGLWQVKFEKEGYETTYSEWLPVPPPQLEVNIGMVQNRQPEVKQAHAYKDGVEVEFDKFMQPAFLNPENILVSQNGEYVKGEVILLNEEPAYADENVKYASKVRFVPNAPFTNNEITLTVTNRVKSYAGLQMQDNYQQTFDIEKELTAIKADSTISIAYEGTQTINVEVLPVEASAGKTLHIKSSSTMIASVDTESITLDNNGKASIVVTGELPGSASLTYTIDGYDLTASTIVNVDIVTITTCAMPTSSITSGSVVDKGTPIKLFCATEGATIYYTVDGSCPCNETDARKVYDGTPIIINEDMTIKAMAVAPGLYESNVAEFTYIVNTTDIDNKTINNQIRIYPLPVYDRVNISAGGKTIKNVKILSTNGIVISSTSKPATTVTLDVNFVTAGIYIINVQTEDNIYSRKIPILK